MDFEDFKDEETDAQQAEPDADTPEGRLLRRVTPLVAVTYASLAGTAMLALLVAVGTGDVGLIPRLLGPAVLVAGDDDAAVAVAPVLDEIPHREPAGVAAGLSLSVSMTSIRASPRVSLRSTTTRSSPLSRRGQS